MSRSVGHVNVANGLKLKCDLYGITFTDLIFVTQ